MKIKASNKSLDKAILNHLRDLNTAIPGFIESYDPETRTVSAIPAINDYWPTDGDPINMDWAPIPDCPVWYLGGNGFVMAPPIKKGDPCLIIFSQRPIDEWWVSDGKTKVVPDLVDTHTESDAIVLAGRLMPQGSIIGEADAENFNLSHESGNFHMKITPDGEMQVKAAKARFGSLDADKALALAEKCDSRLSALETSMNTHTHVCVSPGVPCATALPQVSPGSSTANTKVFTNG